MEQESLVYRLRKRAEIRRQIPSRKSVQEGKPDRMSDLLEEAADELERLQRSDIVGSNQLVLDLALKAGSTHKQNLGVYQFYKDELEKFAELIVRECAAISKDHQRIYYDSHGDRIAKKIEEHFGVE